MPSSEVQTLPSDALEAATHVSPALVMEIQDNPDLMEKLTIGQQVVVSDLMVRRAQHDPEMPTSQLVGIYTALGDNLKKLRRDTPATGAGGAQVVINFITEGGKTVTIEGQSAGADRLPNPEVA